LKNQPFSLDYIDAFAGTGYNRPKTADAEMEWTQNCRYEMGSSSAGFSWQDPLKILLPSSPF